MKKFLLKISLLALMLIQTLYVDAAVAPGSVLTDGTDNTFLSNAIGNNPGGVLLYKRSRDGGSSNTFHNLCDNQGPTLIICRTAYGTTFGAFASESWNGSYYYSQANGSFLFNLTNDAISAKGGLSGANGPYGMYHNYSYGPTFGGGHDLYINSTMDGGYVSSGYSYNTIDGSSYGSYSAAAALVGPGLNYNNMYNGFITEIEVYKIVYNYSIPTVLARNISTYLGAAGQSSITAAQVDSGSYDNDGPVSLSLNKYNFDCSNVGSGGVYTPITFVGTQYQETHSHGGGFDPNNNQFLYPQWADPYVYTYDLNHNSLGSFYTGQNQMMQLWKEKGSSDYYTANWGNFSITKRNGSNVIWSYNTNYYAASVSVQGNFVYAMTWGSSSIIVLDKSTGNYVNTIYLPGSVYSYGGLVVANNHIYFAGLAYFGNIYGSFNAIHVLNMDGTYVTSEYTQSDCYNMAYDGENMWISPNSNTIYGYKISNGNTYGGSGGSNVVRLTVTDILGNTDFQDVSVNVLDTIKPVAHALNFNATLNVFGQATVAGSDLNNGSTDNCSIVKFDLDKTNFDCSNIGANSVILTITDVGGNTDTASAIINISPSLTATITPSSGNTICDGNYTTLYANNENGYNFEWFLNGVAIPNSNSYAYNASAAGVYTVTINGFGCIASSTGYEIFVTPAPSNVITKSGPTTICANDVLTLTASPGQYYYWNNGANTQSIQVSTSGNYSVQVNGFNGCATVSETVNVLVNNLPTVAVTPSGPTSFCNGDSVTLTTAVTGNTDLASIASNFNTNIGNILSPINNQYQFYMDGGDGYGAYSINDGGYDMYDGGNWLNTNLANNISYTNNIVTNNGAFGTNGNYFTSYNSGLFMLAADLDNVNQFYTSGNLGADGGGNTFGYSFPLTIGGNNFNCFYRQVRDGYGYDPSINQLIVVPAGGLESQSFNNNTDDGYHEVSNISANRLYYFLWAGMSAYSFNSSEVQNISSQFLTQIGAGGGSGAVFNNSLSYLWSNGATTPEITVSSTGNYTVVATNANGCSATSSITPVVVNSITTPTISASGSTDLCVGGSIVLTASNSTGTYLWSTNETTQSIVVSNAGSFTVTTTENGCSATSTSTNVFVRDLINPTVLTQNISRTITSTSGAYAVSASDIDNGSFDNCGIVSSTVLGNSIFDCNTVSGVYNVDLLVTDAAGNSSIGSSTITITNACNTAPVAICSAITVDADANCSANVTAMQIGINSTDAENDVLSYSVSPAGPYAIGVHQVTLTVTDPAGLSSSCQTTVTVSDHTLPTVLTQNVIVHLDANGSASITASDINNGSTDNCLIATMSLDKTTFDCSNVGINTVTLTVTDANANTSSQTATVTVLDLIAPTVVTQNVSVQLSATGSASISTADINNGSTDNCSIASIVLDKTTFDCSNVGANTVTLTVTDANANTSSQTATVTVLDLIAPIVVTQNVSVQLSATGSASISTADINNGSTDNCSIASIVLDKTTFDCSNVGANTVTLTVTDANGLVSTATAIVIVSDVTVPNAISLANYVVDLDASGSATINANQIDNGSNDNCGSVTLSLNKTSFDCSNVGDNTVVLTVTDANGNSSTSNTVVTVNDHIAPTYVFPANIDFCQSSNGNYLIENLIAADNCAIASISYSISGASLRFGNGNDASGALNTGLNIITWTITDTHQNVTEFSSSINVNAAPVVSITTSSANAYCSEITLTATSSTNGFNTYLWSTGETTASITLDNSDANGNYTVSVVNANGCSSLSSASYNFVKANLVSSYTILAYKEVAFNGNNNIASGSVGVMSAKGKAKIEKVFAVSGSGSFIKSPKFEIKGNVSVPNKVIGTVSVTLPTNQNYSGTTNGLPSYTVNQNLTKTLTGNYKEVTIKKGANVTLTGTIYKSIKVEEGATVKFTASTINIEELNVGKGKSNALTRVRFDGNTSVRIKEKVKIEDNVVVNQDRFQVTFYYGANSSCGEGHDDDENDEGEDDKFSVKGGNVSVIANVMIPGGKIKVETECDGNVYMTGTYIADRVKSEGKNIIWNGYNCSNPFSNKGIEDEGISPESFEAGFADLIAYPNPTSNVFNFKWESLSDELVSFKVYDVAGRLISELNNVQPNETYQAGSNFAPGVYLLEATQGAEHKVLRVVRTN